jgi:hypothetical protein
MSQDHSITSNADGVAPASLVPLLDADAPPPPPPRPRATADFAASAAMAKDILSLGTHGEEKTDVPVVVDDVVRPQPVPDLDVMSQSAATTAGSPIAPDFFTSRVKSKKRNWRFAR